MEKKTYSRHEFLRLGAMTAAGVTLAACAAAAPQPAAPAAPAAAAPAAAALFGPGLLPQRRTPTSV